MEWKSIDLSSKLSLTCGHYVAGYREHIGNFQKKSVSSPFNWVSRYILFLGKLKRRGYVKGCEKGSHIVRLPRRALACLKRWKNLSFCKTWNNFTLPLFLIRPLTNNHCRTWSCMINLCIDSRTSQK